MRTRDVAIVGGGIFGVSAAIELARAGITVALFERADDLLRGTTAINQYRLHRGYHYPRSPETASACHRSEADFAAEFHAAVVEGVAHHYCIARERTRTSAETFLAFCDAQGLEHRPMRPSFVRPEAIALSVEVRERLFDVDTLRAVCWERLRLLPVDVHLGVDATQAMLRGFPRVVVATYSRVNQFLTDHPAGRQEYQFELCEKPVVRLPATFARHSVVIMDGPFMCIDPLGRSDLFVLGNVVHAIHASHVGVLPAFDGPLMALLDRGVVADPPVTAFPKFISSASEFFDGIEEAVHVGSMFTIRSVPAYKDATDERPTLVRRHDDRLFSIFSGKIGTCVGAARALKSMLTGAATADAAVGVVPADATSVALGE